MKIHRSTAEGVILALQAIFNDRKYADKVIEKTLKSNPRWGARDRRFIAETTYGIVRWYRLLQHASGSNDLWQILGAWFISNNISLPPWEEFQSIREREVIARAEAGEKIRSIRESIPDWLDELGQTELSSRWDKELTSLNEEADVVLRTNTLKTNKQQLRETLADENVRTEMLIDFPDALVLEQRQNIFGTQAFKDGLFEVQDAASQMIAPFLKVEPGLRVIDACAGAGGKTLHIASLMKNKGRIIAMDVEQFKLDELQRRARRAGVTNLETRLIESSKTIKRLENSADRVLLDVPCSGLGVLRRNPDAKWKLSPVFIENVKALQQQILRDYGIMVKPGGLLVYSTCSILPSENENQVKTFLSESKDFSLIDEKTLSPSLGYDGFYMALLKRN